MWDMAVRKLATVAITVVVIVAIFTSSARAEGGARLQDRPPSPYSSSSDTR